jgi:hypothetical protein
VVGLAVAVHELPAERVQLSGSGHVAFERRPHDRAVRLSLIIAPGRDVLSTGTAPLVGLLEPSECSSLGRIKIIDPAQSVGMHGWTRDCDVTFTDHTASSRHKSWLALSTTCP